MKTPKKPFSVPCQMYEAPGVNILSIDTESILCYSNNTEQLVEDTTDPWSLTNN